LNSTLRFEQFYLKIKGNRWYWLFSIFCRFSLAYAFIVAGMVKIVGPDERVSAYHGLKALTDWAAYQHFEESTKGTIEIGKVADFIILDKNPLKIDPMELENLKVVTTYKGGKVVYNK